MFFGATPTWSTVSGLATNLARRAALTLLPAAASAMVRRFVEQSNACCSIPLPLWMETA